MEKYISQIYLTVEQANKLVDEWLVITFKL